MRSSRQSHCLLRALLVALVLAAVIIGCSQATWAQSTEQTTTQLPPKWNDAVTALAGKIAGLAGSQKTISIAVKNISSFTQAETMRIRQALDADLAARGLSVVVESSAGVPAVITLSEGEQGYIWVAEVGNSSAEQVQMVSVPKDDMVLDRSTKQSIALDKRLVWTQPGRFLDFVEFTNPVGFFSTFLVLEPDRLAFYQSADSDSWKFWQGAPIPHSHPWPRDLYGSIDEINGKVDLPDITCSWQLETRSNVQCSPGKREPLATSIRLKVPGRDEAENVVLSEKCGSDSIVLSTGLGDWTQPDSIQGYLVRSPTENAVPSGAAIDVEGPVMALQQDGRQNAARAVVHNLKTGNYEAYVIAASCGR